MTGSAAAELIFVHGFAGDASDWDRVRAELNDSCTGIAIDLPGHRARRAASGPFTIERCADDVIASLSGGSSVLIGHSMGARIVLEAASRAPESVRGLVLVDGSNAPGSPEDARAELETAISTHGLRTVMGDLVRSFLLEGLAAELQDVMRSRASDVHPQAALSYAESMVRWDRDRFERCISEIDAPIEVVQSTSIVDDGWVRSSIDEQPHSRWIDYWDRRSTASVHRVSQTGHYLMIERPTIVSEAIDRMRFSPPSPASE